MIKGYRQSLSIQVRFADIDRLNHVNNACYHTYAEQGRIAYFDKVLSDSIDWIEKGFILARSEMNHLAPLFLRDEVTCYTKIEKLGTKSITMKNLITKKKQGQEIECAEATFILVAMNYIENKSIELPSEWKKRIAIAEGL